MIYDFFVDEDKRNQRLGVLAVPNAVALSQILQNVKDQYGLKREVKWNEMDRYRLCVAVSWLRIATWFHGLKFACLAWPDTGRKGDVLVQFFSDFLNQKGSYISEYKFDSIAFLDFDTSDKRGNLHDYIVRHARILRCYPLDSKASNCLQLVDILLGSWTRCGGTVQPIPREIYSRWPNIEQALSARQHLKTPDFTGADSRTYLAGYASRKIGGILVV